jgi:hypothetical protein
VLDLTVDLDAVSSSYAAMDQRTAMKVMVRPKTGPKPTNEEKKHV